jgi:hypothetical protein
VATTDHQPAPAISNCSSTIPGRAIASTSGRSATRYREPAGTVGPSAARPVSESRGSSAGRSIWTSGAVMGPSPPFPFWCHAGRHRCRCRPVDRAGSGISPASVIRRTGRGSLGPPIGGLRRRRHDKLIR